MSDRELIEYAAKAAHMEGKWDDKDDGWFIPGKHGSWASLIRWDPLTINGQAFDLMVALNIGVHHSWTFADENVPYANVCAQHIPFMIEVGEIKGDDPKAATRRVIVRAAAEIGRSMK